MITAPQTKQSASTGMTWLLVSIHPEWARLIYSGRKTVEVRRVLGRGVRPGARVLLYETSPVHLVTGTAIVADTCRHDDVASIVGRYPVQTCLDREAIERYKGERRGLWTMELRAPVRFDRPLTLDALHVPRPPQNYMFIDMEEG